VPSRRTSQAATRYRWLLLRPFVIVNVPQELKEFGKSPRQLLPVPAPARGLRPRAVKAAQRAIFKRRASHFGTGKQKRVSTALVPVATNDPASCTERPGGRPRADFLAQLIATLAQVPQTRARRRAEPAVAVAAYGARDRAAMPASHTLSRSL
jgi:hypothetical protein